MTIIKELETYFCDVLLRTNTKYVSMKYIVSFLETFCVYTHDLITLRPHQDGLVSLQLFHHCSE